MRIYYINFFCRINDRLSDMPTVVTMDVIQFKM